MSVFKQPRRRRAHLSGSGITHIQWHNPYMVAWWSAAFPGFGHLILNQYVRGVLLTLSEVLVNTLAHINDAMVYSFTGRFELAIEVLEPRWAYAYLLIYMLAMWDSYRSALQNNAHVQLAELENARLQPFYLGKMELHYLERKSPWKAAIFSFAFPGYGQLYNHRVGLGFYGMGWWLIYLTFSHFYTALLRLTQGQVAESTLTLNAHWLMFMPSVIGGSIYHAFDTAIEHNRLFKVEQLQYFREKYGSSRVTIFSENRVK
ncbi:hypothetical protein [Paenibacillus soyae]|uniref:Uncharacterized protein n=1 Tax=Paenibacillus soyae TaxID=2969249 RepID=A0A9X2MUN9_9BACL|nr:hypothetical protein [Paenibacillus soyae]MCR2806880.1 hypothetical protein [Paenibacillus soyae]